MMLLTSCALRDLRAASRLGAVASVWLWAGVSVGGPEDAWRTSDPVVRATNRGVALMERYDYAAAVKAFEEAYKMAPNSTETRVNLAIAVNNRAAKGDMERAEELLDAVIRDDPDNVRALYFRGIIHQYSGRDEPAISCFEQVLKLRPHEACAWYLLARSKSHLNQPWRSELERAVKENPTLVSAYYDLMRIARQEGRDDQAQLYKEKFLKLRESLLSDKVVMPNYNQMGPLAVVRPLSAPERRTVAGGELGVGAVKTVARAPASSPWRGAEKAEQATAARKVRSRFGVQLAMADVNEDGRMDLVTTAATRDGGRSVSLLIGQADGTFAEATAASGLATARNVVSIAFGDYDNDNHVDLFAAGDGPNYLFRGRGDGTFEDVTPSTGTAGPDVLSISAVFLDADHDADLDIYVCNAASAEHQELGSNQLWSNNTDGTFTDIAADASVACRDQTSVMLAPADLDGDRDTDLVVFNDGAPARVFFNDRLGKYHEDRITTEPIRAVGGVAQDFNGDERPDLLTFSDSVASARLYLTDATGALKQSPQFDGCITAVSTWGRQEADQVYNAFRVADVDLDGDLDIAVYAPEGHVLLNDGWGRFVAKTNLWPAPRDGAVLGAELTDLTGDGVPDVLRVCSAGNGRIDLVPTTLTPPSNWLAITPTGARGEEQRTRSPASGFGTRIELRCGVHSQVMTYTGLSGGLSQSRQPLVFGLDGATKADYLAFVWPDGVTQCENGLVAGTHHRVSEMERRVSSCPVLFAWNGERFGFIGDFAGVGGLGYFVAPGEYAPPQVLEHVKIEPEQLAARDGFYELRLGEPMEEVAYVDRLELLAVDHPQEVSVYPDERLVITGPPATHRLLCPANPIFPVTATAPDGTDCTGQLHKADRNYAYQPQLDPRFLGFCRPHSLIVDFADRLAALDPDDRIYLFLNGWIEYPYSQTTYAAGQADVDWQPIRVDRQTPDGQWETIIPDAGAPGGMGRTITIDLTGKVPLRGCRLRLSTNLEIYYDRLFIAADQGTAHFPIRTIPLMQADLRRLGFPLEYSPDGRHPTIYTYDFIEPTSSFKVPRGAYTRYGPVESLLGEFDDRYVILGTGDEIALRFDARGLPPLADGESRSFILVSHAYCKDMDLYTAEPDTVAPLPFQSMTRYPYPPAESYPAGPELRDYHRRFNTRLVN